MNARLRIALKVRSASDSFYTLSDTRTYITSQCALAQESFHFQVSTSHIKYPIQKRKLFAYASNQLLLPEAAGGGAGCDRPKK
eukprot:5883922-Pleurochrysis_carterae.AAC.2